ncbi:MAG: ATP synthase subunit I [Acidimicrobiia bacterium]
MDVEARIGSEMAHRALWVVPLVVLGALVLGGWESGGAALVGSLLAVSSFWLTGRALSWSARRSANALGAAAMGGFFVRLVLLTAALWLVLRVFSLDLFGLVLGLGVTYVALLVLQARKELASR